MQMKMVYVTNEKIVQMVREAVEFLLEEKRTKSSDRSSREEKETATDTHTKKKNSTIISAEGAEWKKKPTGNLEKSVSKCL